MTMSISSQCPTQFGAAANVKYSESQPVSALATGGVALKPIQMGLKIGEIFTSRTEALEKVAKNSHRLIEIGSKLQVFTSSALDSLTTTLKSVVDVFEAIRLIGILHLFFCPQKNGKYFLFDEGISTVKKIDRSFLAGHLVCKSARVLNKWRLIDLGEIAKAKIIGGLTFFHVFTDSLMTMSCVFNIADTVERFQDCTKKNALNEKKIKHWEERPDLLAKVEAGDVQEIMRLEEYWKGKIERKKAEIEKKLSKLDQYNVSATRERVAGLGRDITKLESRLEKVAKQDYKALYTDLAKTKPAEKIEKWRRADERVEDERKLNWVKIATSVSKIFVIFMAFAFTALNIVAAWPIALLLACGIIADSIGLAKIVMEQFSKDKD